MDKLYVGPRKTLCSQKWQYSETDLFDEKYDLPSDFVTKTLGIFY